MKALIFLLLISSATFAQRPEARRQGNPDMIKKNSKTKNLKRPADYWASSGLLDTVPLRDSATKKVKGYAVYEQGTNIAGKPAPRVVGYLDTRKKKIAARPRGVKW